MCLAIPIKILEIKNNKAIADFKGEKEEFDTRLTPGIGIGDYVLASNGFIIKKISAKEAEEILRTLKEEK